MTDNRSIDKGFEKFLPYLKDIDIKTVAYLDRVESLYKLCSDMCPERIEGIFVDDYLKEDGTRDYEDLWFFSNSYCLEAKKLLTQIDLDLTTIKKQVVYWSVKTQDFNFKNASRKSRFSLHFTLLSGITGDLKASKENCNYLQEIIVKYVKANQIPL